MLQINRLLGGEMTTGAPDVLRGVTWEHPRGHGSVAAATDALSLRDGVAVTWSARSLLDFGDAHIKDLAEHHDLLVIDHPHVSSAGAVEALLPLDGTGHDDELADLEVRSVGASHASYRFAGRQYALAIDAAAQVSVHRPDLVQHPPKTWPEVLALADLGRVRWPWKAIDAFSSMISVAGGFGWRSDGPEGVFPVGASGEDALALLHALASKVPEQDRDTNPIDVHEVLSTEDQWWYSPLVFGYSNYSRREFRLHGLRVGLPPAGPAGASGSLLGGAGIAVSARTARPEAALRVAFFLASAPAQTGPYFDGGGQPAHDAAWTSTDLNGRTDDFFRRTRTVLDTAVVRPKLPGWIAFQDLISRATHAVLADEISDGQYWSEVEEASAAFLAPR